MQPLEPFQQRVLDEKKDLDDKRAKLASFMDGALFETLPEEERLRLGRQSYAMMLYSEVLYERIRALAQPIPSR